MSYPSGWTPTEYGQPAAPKPSSLRRNLALVVLAAAIVFLSSGGWYAYTHVIRQDSGVAACQAMHDNAAETKTTPNGPLKISEEQYKQWRSSFAHSRYDEIRQHGTRLMDLIWQLSKLGDDPGLGALTYMGPLTEQMTGLQSACADHGIILDISTPATDAASAASAQPATGTTALCSSVFQAGKNIEDSKARKPCRDASGSDQVVPGFGCTDGRYLYLVEAGTGAKPGWGFGGGKFKAISVPANDPKYAAALQSCLS